jgi:hypothetical protein
VAALSKVGYALAAAVLALAIGACESLIPDRSGTFTIVAPAHEFVDELVVDVVNRTGTVTEIGIARDQIRDGIVADAADPAVLVITWLGGMCDVRTTLTVEPTIDTIRIREATEERAGGCRMAGIVRSIAIRFEPPLAPDFVELVRGDN